MSALNQGKPLLETDSKPDIIRLQKFLRRQPVVIRGTGITGPGSQYPYDHSKMLLFYHTSTGKGDKYDLPPGTWVYIYDPDNTRLEGEEGEEDEGGELKPKLFYWQELNDLLSRWKEQDVRMSNDQVVQMEVMVVGEVSKDLLPPSKRSSTWCTLF